MFSGNCLKANDKNQLLLKSFNFKLYYTEGGQMLAKQMINEAESSLENMENFLGTRLVEQIDIFLSQAPVIDEYTTIQRNGNIVLDNSSIYLSYRGNTRLVIVNLKERLAEILINGMLFGNTVKERLKNNREINVPNWYVPGLAKYVAGSNEPNTSWMADYYEGKLKLNLNLTDKNELAEFGHAVFIHINDSFGMNKLRQVLFYTKLSGKMDYAFQYVLNKSLNWVISDWFKLERLKYLKESNERLPNDPEPISEKLTSSDIIDIKFTKDGSQLDLLIKTIDGVEIWNYDISSNKTLKIYSAISLGSLNVWAFVNSEGIYYLTQSNGIKSRVFIIEQREKTSLMKREKGRVVRTIDLEFNYINTIKEHHDSGFALLAQKSFKMDIFHLNISGLPVIENITNDQFEETDFTFDKTGKFYYSIYDGKEFLLINNKLNNPVYKSSRPFIQLNTYEGNFLSFIQTASDKNVGMIVSTMDSNYTYQVTNYSRSIFNYDYNKISKKVLEGLKYGKRNYIVISEASIDRAKVRFKDTLIIKTSPEKTIDTTPQVQFAYKFITGFEYKTSKVSPSEPRIIKENKIQPKIKELTAPKYEFKPNSIRLGFTNSQFNSPLFASFFPVRAGINNGPNIILGCRITDIYKKYSMMAHIRQPLSGKGTDLDFAIRSNHEIVSYGLMMFNSVYQRELYNQDLRFTAKEIKGFMRIKWHPRLHSTSVIGYRSDVMWPLSVTTENLERKIIRLQQPFIQNTLDQTIFNFIKLNYSQKLNSNFTFTIFKPLNKTGVNTNLFFNLKHDQSFYRIFHLSTRFSVQSSVGQQKTVWLMGGVSNWLRPAYANAAIFNTNKIVLFSTMQDFPGLPYNYKAGTSACVAKIILSIPINPVISQQNFNQNFFKYLTLRSHANIGTAWFGRNPFSIENPDNREVIETGSMTITNYVAKNPLVWSWGLGTNSVLFGYEVGFDYAIGYNERGRIAKLVYITVGREF